MKWTWVDCEDPFPVLVIDSRASLVPSPQDGTAGLGVAIGTAGARVLTAVDIFGDRGDLLGHSIFIADRLEEDMEK